MSAERTVALVPLREPTSAKTRLAAGAPSRLSSSDRAELVTAMLADVIAALHGSTVDEVVVAAGGAGAVAAARDLGARAIDDEPPGAGLNAAVRGAAARIGAGSLLVVPADLPTLTAAEVSALLDRSAPVVVAPTRDGGTGGLLRRPPEVIATAYGPRSASAHLALARAAGVTAEVVERPGFRLDVDTWDDLCRLGSDEVGAATRRILSRLGPRPDRAEPEPGP